jgi:H+-transporting ATPase
MAETGATGTHSSNESSDNPNHLNTKIESGNFDEKHDAAPPANKPAEDEEEDEDMDALIDELESQDGHAEDENEEETTPGGGRVVPEDQLQTDTRIGLTEAEVHARRKKYGMNQMKEEKENLISQVPRILRWSHSIRYGGMPPELSFSPLQFPAF